MLEFNKPNITIEMNDDGTCGTMIMEPLERGYGTTIGNSLRRVMLASLPGTAVVSIKINNGSILHEFSTVPGIKEDVCEIVLNIAEEHSVCNIIKSHSHITVCIAFNEPCTA